MARKCLKKAANRSLPWETSFTPMTSRMECMESWGHPRSMARMPVVAEIIGPMVLPHGQSFRTTNSCTGGNPALRATSRMRNPAEIPRQKIYIYAPAPRSPPSRTGLPVGSVPLTGVGLDHRPRVHLRRVRPLVLRRVVRMDRVGHVHAQHEAPPDGRGVQILPALPLSVRAEGGGQPPHRLAHHGRSGARLAGAPHLLVVEEGHDEDVLLLGQVVLGDGLGGHEAAGQVVDAGGVEELFEGAPEGGHVGVEEAQLEVGDGGDVDVQLGREHFEEHGLLVGFPVGGGVAV
mmetsp:Transcript_17254/g.38902  ORF Transcript_17254/g.38902 Transcript_17254/m.38902 type:complete len:290 (+) Transcript_17254:412-1281(+)